MLIELVHIYGPLTHDQFRTMSNEAVDAGITASAVRKSEDVLGMAYAANMTSEGSIAMGSKVEALRSGMPDDVASYAASQLTRRLNAKYGFGTGVSDAELSDIGIPHMSRPDQADDDGDF